MSIEFILAAALSFLMAAALLVRRRDRTQFVMAAGLVLLGLEAAAAGIAAGSLLPSRVTFWQSVRLWIAAALPACWIAFSLLYGRAFAESLPARRLWPAGAASGAAYLVLLLPLGPYFSQVPLFDGETGRWAIALGLKAYLVQIILVVSFTLAVAGLERTLRASIGRVRWQIKFGVLGLGGYFALRIFTSSEAVLFRVRTSQQDSLLAWGLLVGLVLVAVSLRRGGGLEARVYVSQTVLRGSVTIMVVGAYLVGVGLVAQLLRTLGWSSEIREILIFLALLAVMAVLLSDRANQDLRRWTRLHFRRPTHDYRQIWTRFNAGISDRLSEDEIGRSVVRIVSESLESLSVTLWTTRASGAPLSRIATTGTKTELDPAILQAQAAKAEGPVDYPDTPNAGQASSLRPAAPSVGQASSLSLESGTTPAPFAALHEVSKDARPTMSRDARPTNDKSKFEIRKSKIENHKSQMLLLPLRHQDTLLGVLTVGDKVRGKPFTLEDRELLEVLGAQTSALLSNLRLARRLQEASELQAYQAMSAFFLHDLKNLASRLSLTVHNFPRHYDNPEFREEALATMSQSVEKIRGMCNRLAQVREKPELRRVPTDLQAFTRQVLDELRPQLGTLLQADLQPTPQVLLDPDQFRKVLVNLVLNAKEAIDEKRGEEGRQKTVGGRQKTEDRRKKAEALNVEPGTLNQEPGTRNQEPGTTGNEADSIRVSTRSTDTIVTLEVSDTGLGMTEEFLKTRLFHPFQTTKKEGMGIGLFQSKVIVEQHGGRIEAVSRPGKGTGFQVILPPVKAK